MSRKVMLYKNQNIGEYEFDGVFKAGLVNLLLNYYILGWRKDKY